MPHSPTSSTSGSGLTKPRRSDRKSTRLNSSHTVIYTLSLHDALPIFGVIYHPETERLSHYFDASLPNQFDEWIWFDETSAVRSEEHTSELQSHSDLHSFPTRRSSDLRRDLPSRNGAVKPLFRCLTPQPVRRVDLV